MNDGFIDMFVDEALQGLRRGKGLIYRNMPLSVADAEKMADAILEAETLPRVSLENCHMGDAQACLLAEAIARRNDLQMINLDDNAFGDAGAEAMLAALEHHPQLASLSLTNTAARFSSATLAAVAESVASHAELLEIQLEQAHFDHSSARAMAQALEGKRGLASCMLGEASDPQATASINDTIRNGEYPCLVNYHNSGYDEVIHTRSIKNGDMFQKAKEIADSRPLETLRYIALCASFRPLMRYCHAVVPDSPQEALDFLLPSLPEGFSPDLTSLFTPDERGFSPIEKPELWQQHPDVIAQLAARGELARALPMTTAKGSNLAQCALAFGDLGTSLPVLRAAGLDNASLLAQPDAAFLLERRGALRQMFSYDQWKGQPPEAFAQALRVLPEEYAPLVPNATSLRVQLAQDKQATQPRGR